MSEEQVFTQCTVGGPVRVYVEDGVIKRMRPIIFDEDDAASWTIEARGRTFTPPRKTTLQSYEVPERTRVYTNRIQYPLRRKNFDPDGRASPRAARQGRVRAHLLGRGARPRGRGDHPHPRDPRPRGHHRHDPVPSELGLPALQARSSRAASSTSSATASAWTIPTAGRAGTGAPRTPGATGGASATASSPSSCRTRSSTPSRSSSGRWTPTAPRTCTAARRTSSGASG